MYSDEGDEVRIDSDDTDSQKEDRSAEQNAAAQSDQSGAAAASADAQKSSAADAAGKSAASGEHSDASADGQSAKSEKSDDASADGSDSSTGLTALGQAKKEAADYLAALQRERADFINYRNRAEKERKQSRDFGVQDVLTALLPALDDLDRIAENGKMTDDLQAVQKQLDRAFGKFGVTKFGAKGEEFDPTKHEAILHRQSADVTAPSVDAVVESGYKIGDRVIRAARVVVVSPMEASSDSADSASSDAGAADAKGADSSSATA